MININFKYKLLEDDNWYILPITLEEYIDHNYFDESKELSIENILPLYDSDAREYLPQELRDSTQFIVIEEIDMNSLQTEVFKEYFWNNGENSLIEVIRTNENITDREIIIDMKHRISENYVVSETIRLSRINNVLQPNFHGYVKIDNDGVDEMYGEPYSLKIWDI